MSIVISGLRIKHANQYKDQMNTLDYILNKFSLGFDDSTRMPIEIPDIGRNGLAKLFHELGFKSGAEIGVLEGEYSEIICKANPEAKLYSIDPWVPHRGYTDFMRKETFEKAYAAAKARLAPYNCEIVKKFSLDAVKDFADESLDFVYIDGDHNFQNCTDDIAEWSKKVKYGGIISGHDYIKHKKPTNIHVYEVVRGYTEAYNIRPWFLLAAKAVIDGIITAEARTFMWVKMPSSGAKSFDK